MIRVGDVPAVLGQLPRDAVLVPAGVAGEEAGRRGGAVQAQAAAEADTRPPNEDVGQGEGQLMPDGVDSLGTDIGIVGADALAKRGLGVGQDQHAGEPSQSQVIRDLGSALHISRSYNVYA